ncbi:hypothetical protein BAUCODRAFT_378353 [Baudoinia panamericana UAMH 10762]|uniref:Uncharacterized protein n=1 Tax=Baudoinia panamericana (strain UAMH 10762) TaxID=717646 RepID=M2N3Z0_BAUPA|nr:uncharacterized protein BAUCODRAFT_378353 [Baudoinia panamericana UAMH 10762]EMC98703.1 hypothetical protein BAUCODRAFT_378353 [Baudoinia panamericana UAMH 10762]
MHKRRNTSTTYGPCMVGIMSEVSTDPDEKCWIAQAKNLEGIFHRPATAAISCACQIAPTLGECYWWPDPATLTLAGLDVARESHTANQTIGAKVARCDHSSRYSAVRGSRSKQAGQIRPVDPIRLNTLHSAGGAVIYLSLGCHHFKSNPVSHRQTIGTVKYVADRGSLDSCNEDPMWHQLSICPAPTHALSDLDRIWWHTISLKLEHRNRPPSWCYNPQFSLRDDNTCSLPKERQYAAGLCDWPSQYAMVFR